MEHEQNVQISNRKKIARPLEKTCNFHPTRMSLSNQKGKPL